MKMVVNRDVDGECRIWEGAFGGGQDEGCGSWGMGCGWRMWGGHVRVGQDIGRGNVRKGRV